MSVCVHVCVCGLHVCMFVTWQRGRRVRASEALCVEIGLWGKTEHTLPLTSPSSEVTKLGKRVRKDKKIVTQSHCSRGLSH